MGKARVWPCYIVRIWSGIAVGMPLLGYRHGWCLDYCRSPVPDTCVSIWCTKWTPETGPSLLAPLEVCLPSCENIVKSTGMLATMRDTPPYVPNDYSWKKTPNGLLTSTTAITTTSNPCELRMNVEFTRERAVVRTQVENKHESLIRKALSWITMKSRREDVSRTRSANTSAAVERVIDCCWQCLLPSLLTD